jgi:hypothetical protein
MWTLALHTTLQNIIPIKKKKKKGLRLPRPQLQSTWGKSYTKPLFSDYTSKILDAWEERAQVSCFQLVSL